MTKWEVAIKLAEKYVALEEQMFKTNEELQQLREKRGTLEFDGDERRVVRSELKALRASMETVAELSDTLGIGSKKWYDAITEAYRRTSNK